MQVIINTNKSSIRMRTEYIEDNIILGTGINQEIKKIIEIIGMEYPLDCYG